MQICYRIVGLIAVVFFITVHGQAQYADTFLVTIADKTAEHPHYNEGYSKGYLVNGLQSPTITLVRDSLYLFDTHEVPQSLIFDFYTIPIGGSAKNYRNHVKEHYVSTGLWVIQATDEDPDTLYYASFEQPWMGGMILIVDSIASSVNEDEILSTLAGAEAYPNPFAEETELRFRLDARSTVRVEVVNAVGQVVQRQDGRMMEAGDARLRLQGNALAAGMYFYRVEALSEGKRSVATGTLQLLR